MQSNGGGILNGNIQNLNKYLVQNIAIKKNSAPIDGNGIYNCDMINPDHSNCDFGTGGDANMPDDHN